MPILNPGEETAVTNLVLEAGRRLIDFWPKALPGGGLKIFQKPDTSFVTEADYASNDILVPGLRALFPDHEILSEEGPPDPAVATSRAVWILDPLDGTQSFIDRIDDFSILLALCLDRRPEFGVMHLPLRHITAVGRAGGGAQLNGTSLRVSNRDEPAPRSVYLRHLHHDAPFIFQPRVDTGLALLNICVGEFDGVIIRLRRHREWDLAAPALLIRESGGMVTDEHGRELQFHENSITYQYFVASNGRVHGQLLELIRTVDRSSS